MEWGQRLEVFSAVAREKMDFTDWVVFFLLKSEEKSVAGSGGSSSPLLDLGAAGWSSLRVCKQI